MARSQTNPMILGQETNTTKNYQRKPNQREIKLAEAILYSENIDDDFSSALICSNMDNADGTVYTGAAGEELGLHSGRAGYEVHQSAVATPAVVTPYQSASGLELKPVAAADALELTNGTTALSRAAHVIGSLLATDAKELYFSAKIKIDDISDVTELWCGWRKAEAYQADPDNYDELCAFNIGKDADGQIEIHTILNGGTTAETDTTETDWADGAEKTLEIRVKNNGKCEFLIDGSAPTVTTTFTFDSGEVILPFVMLDTETGDPGVSISEWKVGYR
jgi:hypothetical protein